MNSNVYLFDPRQSVMWRTWGNRSLTSDKVFYGQNPPNGAMINFYLKDALADRENVTITIVDAAGQTVRTVNCTRPNPNPPAAPQGGGFGGGGGGGGGGFGFGGGGNQQCNATAGINRYVWDMRSRPAAQPGAQAQAQPGGEGGPGGPGGGGGFGGGLANLGYRVDPGTYTIKIKRGDTEQSKTLTIIEDPRVTNFTAEDRAKKRAALMKLQPLVIQGQLAATSIAGLRTNVNNAIESWKRPGTPQVPDNIKTMANDLLKKIDAIYINWGTPPSDVANLSSAGPPLVQYPTPLSQRAAQLLGGIENSSNAPTDYELAQIDALSQRIPPAADAVRKLISEDLVNLNNAMRDAKIPYIQPPTLGGGGGGRRGGDDDEDRDDPDFGGNYDPR